MLNRVITRPGVAGAVLQTPSSLINYFIKWSFVKISSWHLQSKAVEARELTFPKNYPKYIGSTKMQHRYIIAIQFIEFITSIAFYSQHLNFTPLYCKRHIEVIAFHSFQIFFIFFHHFQQFSPFLTVFNLFNLFHCFPLFWIHATILKRREIQCLLYAGFFNKDIVFNGQKVYSWSLILKCHSSWPTLLKSWLMTNKYRKRFLGWPRENVARELVQHWRANRCVRGRNVNLLHTFQFQVT